MARTRMCMTAAALAMACALAAPTAALGVELHGVVGTSADNLQPQGDTAQADIHVKVGGEWRWISALSTGDILMRFDDSEPSGASYSVAHGQHVQIAALGGGWFAGVLDDGTIVNFAHGSEHVPELDDMVLCDRDAQGNALFMGADPDSPAFRSAAVVDAEGAVTRAAAVPQPGESQPAYAAATWYLAGEGLLFAGGFDDGSGEGVLLDAQGAEAARLACGPGEWIGFDAVLGLVELGSYDDPAAWAYFDPAGRQLEALSGHGEALGVLASGEGVFRGLSEAGAEFADGSEAVLGDYVLTCGNGPMQLGGLDAFTAVDGQGRFGVVGSAGEVLLSFEFDDYLGSWLDSSWLMARRNGVWYFVNARELDGQVQCSLSARNARLAFGDVSEGSYLVDEGYLGYVVAEGIMGGSDGWFNPQDELKRQQLAAMLYRLAGSPEANVSVLAGYADGARVSAYARPAVAWAVEQGIMGSGTTSLAPAGNVSRAQLATMLYRYAQRLDASVQGSAAAFAGAPDARSVPTYAREAMGWCFAEGIITGGAGGKLNPAEPATRAQTAKMITVFATR